MDTFHYPLQQRQRKILILTSQTGGGHMSLAQALRDRLQQDYAIRIEDLLPEFFPWYYQLITQKASWLWSPLFHLTDNPRVARLEHLAMLPLITPRLTPLLHHFQPNLVLSVHPLLTHAVKHVLDKHAQPIPFAMLFSDPMRVHCTWFTERTAAAVFAPTREMYVQALAQGFDPTRLHFVGWPVRSQFTAVLKRPREQVIEELNCRQHWDLDPTRLTIFAASGAEGATDMERAVRLVLAVSQDIQVIVAAGKNRALYRHCQGVKNLYAFPFTGEVAPFMAAAHVTMGRCSPNILFESLTLGKPLLATSTLPGQEVANLRFIGDHGLGWSALEDGQLRRLVTALVTDLSSESSLLNAMRAKVKAYQSMNAAANESIVPLIRTLIEGASPVH